MAFGRIASALAASPVLRFLVAGAANTLFGLAVYAGTILVGSPTWLALLVGIVAGIAFNFISFGAYAFRDLSLKRLPRFLCAYSLIYLVNIGTLDAVRRIVPDPIVAQVILTLPMAALSWILMSRFVFRKTPPR
jgi:putative flippase GtrA